MSDALNNYLLENMKDYSSLNAEEVSTVKVGAGRLFRLSVVNVNASPRFIYVFDSASADSGRLLVAPFQLAAGGSVDLTWGYGKQFTAGCRVHASSSQATFTASAGNDLRTSASYI